MSHRVALFSLVLSASIAISLSLQAQSKPGPGDLFNNMTASGTTVDSGPMTAGDFGSIAGTVSTSDHHPASDARIEVHSISTGALAAAGYVSPNGTFRLKGLPTGSYEIVATSGISEAREQIEVTGLETTVNLMLPHSDTSDPNGEKIVSVSQLKVPEKARKELAKAYEAVRKNNLDEGRKHIDKALAIEPNYADAIVLRGVLALNDKNTSVAMEDFTQALQYDSSCALAYIGTGAVYNMEGKYEDALRALDRGIALKPTSWQAQFEMSKANLGTGNFEAALQHANKAQELVSSEFSPIHLVKGHALLGLKDYNAAVSEFEAFLSKDGQSPDAPSVRQELQAAKAFVTTAAMK